MLQKLWPFQIQVHSSRVNKLTLHFRPEDPYSHPAFGELHPCNNLLLKISRKKSTEGYTAGVSHSAPENKSADTINSGEMIGTPKTQLETSINSDHPDSVEAGLEVCRNGREFFPVSKKVEAQVSEEVHFDLSADIVARVSEAYHFNGMVDYQYVVAVHADVAHRKKRNWVEMEPHLEKVGLMDVDHEDLMILLPPLFSPKDVPEKLVLRPSVTMGAKKKLEGVVQQRWEMDIEPCLAIDFKIKEIPKKINWEDHIPRNSDQWECQMAVSKLFNERPIWLKESLNERLLDQGLKVGDYMFRRLLFRTAYYFSNGPFLRFWIRKGYDPRKDPESRIYQRTDFRVPPVLRNYCDANVGKGLKHRWEDICAFRVFPYKCQVSLQLFELVDDYIQQEISKPSKQTACSCATGWFPCHVLDSLRLRVAVRFLSIYPGTGAEDLLVSASERFEKSKRIHFLKNDLKLDGDGHGQVNRGNEDKEEANGDDDDHEEEDDIEVDDGEEELDEAFMAGEDGEIPLQPQTYLDGDNVSRNYLQELFGTFPSNEASGGGKQPDADTSDGEYQIYEQDSDSNYSDGYHY